MIPQLCLAVIFLCGVAFGYLIRTAQDRRKV